MGESCVFIAFQEQCILSTPEMIWSKQATFVIFANFVDDWTISTIICLYGYGFLFMLTKVFKLNNTLGSIKVSKLKCCYQLLEVYRWRVSFLVPFFLCFPMAVRSVSSSATCSFFLPCLSSKAMDPAVLGLKPLKLWGQHMSFILYVIILSYFVTEIRTDKENYCVDLKQCIIPKAEPFMSSFNL
jgi:hypothetical protein